MLKGSYPFFPLSDRVIYITRGFQAEERNLGLPLREWLEALEQVTELTLAERYEIRNPHTQKVEKWTFSLRSRNPGSDVSCCCTKDSGTPEGEG